MQNDKRRATSIMASLDRYSEAVSKLVAGTENVKQFEEGNIGKCFTTLVSVLIHSFSQ